MGIVVNISVVIAVIVAAVIVNIVVVVAAAVVIAVVIVIADVLLVFSSGRKRKSCGLCRLRPPLTGVISCWDGVVIVIVIVNPIVVGSIIFVVCIAAFIYLQRSRPTAVFRLNPSSSQQVPSE